MITLLFLYSIKSRKKKRIKNSIILYFLQFDKWTYMFNLNLNYPF